MLIRALIVLLAVLNLGVAAWWGWSPTPAPYAATPLPAETPTLQLADAGITAPASNAAPAASASKAAPASPPPASVAAAVAPAHTVTESTLSKMAAPVAQCLRFGPFASKDEADALLSRLGPLASKRRSVDTSARTAKAWRVWVPPQADTAAADALAKKIAAAGFNDNFVIREGENANAIALGVYRNHEGAEKRLADLQKAGFPAQLVANGDDAPAQWWADVALTADASAAAARQRSGGAAKPLDCTSLK